MQSAIEQRCQQDRLNVRGPWSIGAWRRLGGDDRSMRGTAMAITETGRW